VKSHDLNLCVVNQAVQVTMLLDFASWSAQMDHIFMAAAGIASFQMRMKLSQIHAGYPVKKMNEYSRCAHYILRWNIFKHAKAHVLT
jgi:hypothetical protein